MKKSGFPFRNTSQVQWIYKFHWLPTSKSTVPQPVSMEKNIFQVNRTTDFIKWNNEKFRHLKLWLCSLILQGGFLILTGIIFL